MDVNVMRARCRVIRTASPDVVTPSGLSPQPWENFGYTDGDIVTFVQWAMDDPRWKTSIGWFDSKTGHQRPIILHGEAEVLRV
jgi:hypothetical protein